MRTCSCSPLKFCLHPFRSTVTIRHSLAIFAGRIFRYKAPISTRIVVWIATVIIDCLALEFPCLHAGASLLCDAMTLSLGRTKPLIVSFGQMVRVEILQRLRHPVSGKQHKCLGCFVEAVGGAAFLRQGLGCCVVRFIGTSRIK